MRVLITASTLPRWDGDATPGFVLDQAIALRHRYPDLDIHILAPHHAGAALAESRDGINLHRFRYFWPEALQRLVYPAILPNLRHNRWLVLQVPFLLAAELVAILRFCRHHRPDVLYSHWFAPQALVGSVAAGMLGIPHVFTSHSSDVQVMGVLPVVGPALVRRIVGSMRAGTVVSRRTLAKLRAFFPVEADWQRVAPKIRILPMGVQTADLPLPTPARRAAAKAGLGLAGSQVVLFVGRLTAKKGLHVLLDAFRRVLAVRADAVLLIAGDGELRSAIEQTLEVRGGSGSVRLLGYVTGERKQQVLAAADILVVPSIITADNDAEGLPVALLEGLAAGKLCIATDVSGADDILTHGEDGFIVRQQDPEQLAATLVQALSLDPAAIEAIGERARRRVRPFDWNVLAEAHYRHLFTVHPAGSSGRLDQDENGPD